MEATVVSPKNKAQQDALLAFLTALKIPFERSGVDKSENRYSDAFNQKMARAEADIAAGRTQTIQTEDLWK